MVVDSGDDLLIEGYPSAANSLTRETFMLTQPGISVASHLHSAAHVRRALALGVPALIVLRPPVESIASIMARFPGRRFRPAIELKAYERFYTEVSTLADRVALSRFEDTVTRLGTVTQAMNSQLGTRFVPVVDGDPAIAGRIQAILDAWSAAVFGELSAVATARPSDARRDALDVARTVILAPRFSAVLARCEQLHAHLAGQADQRLVAWATLRSPATGSARPSS